MRAIYLFGVAVALAVGGLVGGYVWGSAPRSTAISPTAIRTGFDPQVVDIGPVPWNSTGRAEAVFRNGSAEDVTIASIRASCNCTGFRASDYTGKTVPAGDAIDFGADVQTGLHLGSRTTEVELMLTSGAIHSLVIDFECYSTYVVEPREVPFGEIELSESDATRDARVVLFRSDSAEIVAVDPDVAWVDASCVKSGAGVTQIALHPRADALTHGQHVGTVHVSTTDPYVPEFAIRVKATGVADLRPVPAHVFVRRGREGAVTVLDRNGRVVHISEYGGDTEGMTIGTRLKTQLYLIPAQDAPITAKPRIIWVGDDSGRRSRFFVTITE